MKETTKLHHYRQQHGYDIYLDGHGIDIGCGNDCLSPSSFSRITSVTAYDTLVDPAMNANTCAEIPDQSFDFVYSSHCLEHMIDPDVAIRNWIRICKPKGFLVCCVPHELWYEKYAWPSMFNGDHKTSWSLENKSNLPKSIHMPEFLGKLTDDHLVNVIRAETLLHGFDFNYFKADQTLSNAVCQIEFVLQKL